MKRLPFFIAVLSLIFVLTSCRMVEHSSADSFLRYNFNSSVPESVQYETLFREYNKYNGRVAMGISGPYENKENAVAAATRNAVQFLSFYRGLAVQTDMSTIIRDGEKDELDFDSMTVAGTSDSIFQKTARDMKIVEVIWLGGSIGAAVFATLPEMEEVKWNSSWANPAAADAGVIMAHDTSYARYEKFVNAIESSVFRSAMNLVNGDRGAVNVDNTLIKTTGRSYENQSYSISGTRLTSFTVVAFRYDRESGKVHSLVAASKQER